MKKITLSLIICFAFSFNSNAQIFSEDFSGSWQTSWTQYDEDGSGGIVWFTFSGKMSSWSLENGTTQRFPNHYSVSPAIDATGTSGLSLDYKAGSQWPTPNEGEVFTVYASTGSTVSDFLGMTTAITVNSGTIDIATVPAAQGMLGNFNLDLSALDGQTEIYIAFRHHDTPIDQSMLQIDDVVLTATLGIEDNTFSGFKYFVDSSNVLQLSSTNKNIDNITIYNLLGQDVLTKKVSSTNASINLSQLNTSLYIVKINIEGIEKSYKILKK